MSLMAGSTLQQGKYLIRATLHQSDFGVTYKATHCLLDQTVIIQTLNDSLQQHPRFEQLHQQFLAEARRLTHQPTPAIGKIRDCFEEVGMPFLVSELIPGQSATKSEEWLSCLRPLVLEAAIATAAQPIASNTISSSTEHTSTNGNGNSSANSTPLEPQPWLLNQTAVVTAAASPQRSPSAVATAPVISLSANKQPPMRSPQVVKAKPNRWLPIALVLTSIVAGLGGAAFGWIFRFNQPGQASNGSSLFGSEQSFPAQEDWLGEDPYADDYSDSPNNFAPSSRSIEPQEVVPSDADRPIESVSEPAPRRRAVIEEPSTLDELYPLPEPLPEEKFFPTDPAVNSDLAPTPVPEAGVADPVPAAPLPGSPAPEDDSSVKVSPAPASPPAASFEPPAGATESSAIVQ